MSMNKKNFPIFISVLITSVFFTMVFYFVYTNIENDYKEMRRKNFADASLDRQLSSNDIKKLEKISGIKIAGGLSEEKLSALYKNAMLAINFQDSGINQMMEYSDLIEGRFAKNNNEIVLSKNIIEKFKLTIGDSISLSIGDRYFSGKKRNPTSNYNEKESFKSVDNKVYEIVGIYDLVYNKYLNVNFALTVPDENMNLNPYLRFDDFKEAYKNREEIQREMEKHLGKKVDLEFSDAMIDYYGVKRTGMEALSPILIDSVLILFAVLLFVFFIRNIFRVWGLRKVKKLSLYKSIGTTDFQIYQILLKEAMYISVLPVLSGHLIGYFTMNFIYKKMQEIGMVDRILPLSFSFYLSFLILLIAFFIIILALISPLREIAKISIIDGIRGNFYSKEKKKKLSHNLWRELRLNNMTSIKSLRYITAVGTIIVSCFLIIVGISLYNRDFYADKDSDYNMKLVYKTTRQEPPEVFGELMNKLPYEKGYVSRAKYFNVSPEFEFSNEAKENGIEEHLEGYFKELDEKRIDGSLIGLEESELEKLGGKKGEFLLLNIVQKDPRTPLSKAKYIKYMDNPRHLMLYLSGGKPVRKVPIDKLITSSRHIEERLNPFDIQVFTDLETQKNLIINHEKAKEAKANFVLKIKVKESDLLEAKEYVENILKASSAVDEQFYIVTADEISKNQYTSMKAFIFIILGIGIVILLLNITNGYASINISLLSRKKEIGSLFSCGMEKESIKKMYLHEFMIECLKSLAITVVVTILLMMFISVFSAALPMRVLLAYYPWTYFGLFSVLIYTVNIILYYFSLHHILRQEAVDLIRRD